MSISVCKATGVDLAEVSETLAQAFFEDPVISWWIPEDHRRKAILPEFFRVVGETTLPKEELYRSADGAGAAIWMPPGGQPSEEEMSELAPRLGEATAEYANALFEFLEIMDAKHPNEAHFYLFLLGTRPPQQSKGIGSALLRAVLDGCDETGTPAYLEATSEGNKRLYLRHGFEVTDEIHLRDSPTVWCMWRTPQRQ
ncbi:MAG: GNAT family N-acetyltransferase [Acidimicrobiia bacterium]